MVHIIAFTNTVLVKIIFRTDKVFYKTVYPGRVSVITSYASLAIKFEKTFKILESKTET